MPLHLLKSLFKEGYVNIASLLPDPTLEAAPGLYGCGCGAGRQALVTAERGSSSEVWKSRIFPDQPHVVEWLP